MSATLLRGWAVNGKLAVVDCRDRNAPKVYSKGPRGVAYEREFTSPSQVAQLEASWGAIETPAGRVLRKLQNDTQLDPGERDTVKELVALHLARSYEVHKIWSDGIEVDEWLNDIDRLLGNPDLLGKEVLDLRESLRHLSSDASERDLTYQAVSGYLKDQFTQLVLYGHERVRKYVDRAGLELYRVLVGDELIISDTPAVAVTADLEKVGFGSGLTLPDGPSIIMPLTPNTLAVIGPQDSTYILAPAAIQRLNIIQCRRAQRYLVCRPGSELEEKIIREIKMRG